MREEKKSVTIEPQAVKSLHFLRIKSKALTKRFRFPLILEHRCDFPHGNPRHFLGKLYFICPLDGIFVLIKAGLCRQPFPALDKLTSMKRNRMCLSGLHFLTEWRGNILLNRLLRNKSVVQFEDMQKYSFSLGLSSWVLFKQQ